MARQMRRYRVQKTSSFWDQFGVRNARQREESQLQLIGSTNKKNTNTNDQANITCPVRVPNKRGVQAAYYIYPSSSPHSRIYSHPASIPAPGVLFCRSRYQIPPSPIARLPPETRTPMTDMYSRHGAMPTVLRQWSCSRIAASALPFAPPSTVVHLRFSNSSVRSRWTIGLRGSEGSRVIPPVPVIETKDG